MNFVKSFKLFVDVIFETYPQLNSLHELAFMMLNLFCSRLIEVSNLLLFKLDSAS